MYARVLNTDPLYDYREFCKMTQGQMVSTKWKPANEVEYWIKQFLCNHSTIRCIHIRIIAEEEKSCVMQIIRATKGHPQPEVCSSRPDWTDKPRPTDPYAPTRFVVDYTPESFLAMARQRLCTHTEDRTRKVIKEWVRELKLSREPILRALGVCSVPQCEYLGKCPELKCCGLKEPIYKDYFS